MLAYMTRGVDQESGVRACLFHSRTRGLWEKGPTSGT